jgi:hypothetical protein
LRRNLIEAAVMTLECYTNSTPFTKKVIQYYAPLHAPVLLVTSFNISKFYLDTDPKLWPEDQRASIMTQ